MKLIAVDVDGTLIRDDYTISERTKEALIKAQKHGHKVVIASGRSPQGVIEYAKELEMDKYESYISNQNGTIVTDMKTGKVVIEHFMDLEQLREILQFSDNLDIDYMIYLNDSVYSNKEETYRLAEVVEKNFDVKKYIVPDLSKTIDFTPHNILFSQDPERIIEPANILKEKYGELTETMYSAPYFFEIMPKGVSKGSSLLEIADYLGIDHQDIIAFGDQGNDASMIQMAGVGVAMGNAIPELKDMADYITLSNEEDGIADYLEKYVL